MINTVGGWAPERIIDDMAPSKHSHPLPPDVTMLLTVLASLCVLHDGVRSKVMFQVVASFCDGGRGYRYGSAPGSA